MYVYVHVYMYHMHAYNVFYSPPYTPPKCTRKKAAVNSAASTCAAYLANPWVSSGNTLLTTLSRPNARTARIRPTLSLKATSLSASPYINNNGPVKFATCELGDDDQANCWAFGTTELNHSGDAASGSGPIGNALKPRFHAGSTSTKDSLS